MRNDHEDACLRSAASCLFFLCYSAGSFNLNPNGLALRNVRLKVQGSQVRCVAALGRGGGIVWSAPELKRTHSCGGVGVTQKHHFGTLLKAETAHPARTFGKFLKKPQTVYSVMYMEHIELTRVSAPRREPAGYSTCRSSHFRNVMV